MQASASLAAASSAIKTTDKKNEGKFNILINTKKAFKTLCIFILRRFGLFLIHLQSKNKATLGNASNSKPKDSVTQEITVWRKRRQKQNQDRQPCQIR